MSTFGTGLVAAAQLRQRILERLGAEPEWTESRGLEPVRAEASQ